ncbi:hypothetical protein [Hymenobacter convexus]|uniref:hypothetical protein n=1 Tax=Hymenobacter sp. CA1UV-4 TaxID=3063782 RepID=UPI002712320D|nr:hypothetical protein [Hymenobacter sp. CA1UV-4]MDO7851687.1 hypothetical protein [Hymenobacter sp. CA1UV-4]
MTDKEANCRAMARRAVQKRTDYRKLWEPVAPRMVPDFLKVQQLLADFDAIGTALAGTSNRGNTDAKDRAEDAAVVAAMRVVKGLRNVQLNQYRPELAKAAGYQQSDLDRLRDENLVKALEAIAAAATGVAAAAMAERVMAKRLTALTETMEAYRPLVGTPRGQMLAGSTLRTTGRKLVAQLRTDFEPLDTRMDSLGEEPEFEKMAAEYKKARRVVDAGHGPANDAAAPAA